MPSVSSQLEGDLALAHQMADLATAIALAHFGRPVASRLKPDGSLVTDADLEVEEALLARLADARPSDAVMSEESGMFGEPARRTWLIDPIDGTAAFADGRRAWGTHLALLQDGVVTVALFTRPTEGWRWWASRGHGAYSNPDGAALTKARRLRVAGPRRRSAARVAGLLEPGSQLAHRLAPHFTWAADEVSALAALLRGELDAVVDEGGDPWDRAPGALLVVEAGGVFEDLEDGTRLDAPVAAYANRSSAMILRAVLSVCYKEGK
jgi:histidinol-phosphatase